MYERVRVDGWILQTQNSSCVRWSVRFDGFGILYCTMLVSAGYGDVRCYMLLRQMKHERTH